MPNKLEYSCQHAREFFFRKVYVGRQIALSRWFDEHGLREWELHDVNVMRGGNSDTISTDGREMRINLPFN